MRNFVPAAAAAMMIIIGMADAAQAAPIDKQVTIRAIQLCNNAGADCASATTYEAAADKIWAQAGIDFVFLPTISWNSSTFLRPIYDPGSAELLMFAAGSSLFGDPALTGILNMYFVQDLLPTNTLYGEGCGAPVFSGVCNNQVGVVINSTLVDAFNGGLGRIDTVAHEVGHVLGLGHGDFGAGAADNLMTTGSSRTPASNLGNIAPDGDNLDKLTALQIAEARRSFYVTDVATVPEPASMALLAFGVAGIAWQRRRKQAA